MAPGVNLTHFVFLKLMISRSHRRLIMVRQTVIESNLPECPVPQSLFLHFLLGFEIQALPCCWGIPGEARSSAEWWSRLSAWCFCEFCHECFLTSEHLFEWVFTCLTDKSQVIYCWGNKSMHSLTAFLFWWTKSKELALQRLMSLTQVVEDTHI